MTIANLAQAGVTTTQAVFVLPERQAAILQAEAVLRFPPVPTLDTFRRWYEAMREKTVEPPEVDVAFRLYRGATAVGTLEVTGLPDTAVAAYVGADPNDALDVTLMEWVNECFERYMGDLIPTRPWAELVAESLTTPLTGHSFEVAAFVDEFPALSGFTGHIAFPKHLTAGGKRAWEKGLALLESADAGHVDNTLFLRQYRAALQLLDEAQVMGLREGEDTAVAYTARSTWRDPKQVPLVLVSFLVRSADIYLTVRSDPKKLRQKFGLTA
jgi:hypothetical protein